MMGIRVDANKKIAMGHLMRCMSIAIQIKKREETVIFIVSDVYAKEYIEKNGFICVCLQNNYNEKNLEINEMSLIVEKYQIDLLLIDSYEVTEEYFCKIHKFVKLAYIDDLFLFKYDVDIIINYTIGVSMKNYNKYSYDSKVKLLCGIEYVPLKESFSNGKIEIKEKIENVMFTTGGADVCDLIYDFINNLSIGKINFHIVLGMFYNDIEKIRKLAENMENIFLYYNVKNMHEIMEKCDIAASAGGTTIAELCACGVPTICFATADNQLPGIKAYQKEKLIIYAGDARYEKLSVIDKINENITSLMDNKNVREKLSSRAKEYIDGFGANRIANELIVYCNKANI